MIWTALLIAGLTYAYNHDIEYEVIEILPKRQLWSEETLSKGQ
jgi:hypothetical protein